MSEFQLDYGGPKALEAFKALDAFTRGYIEAMFFTSTGSRDDDDLESASVAELATDALDDIRLDCAAFQASEEFVQAKKDGKFTDDQAGRDFWYTRNGHGVGFWIRDEIYGAHEEALTELAQSYGEKYLERGDDRRLYLTW